MATMVALAMASAGVSAHAAPSDLFSQQDDFTPKPNQIGPPAPHRTLQWDNRKGRWGLKLGVEQRTDGLAEWRDVQPGLYYKLTPRLHIGGAVSLAPTPQINPRLAEPAPTAPRVRLETTFKF